MAVRYCQSAGLQPNDAEDVVQDVWLKILPRFQQFLDNYDHGPNRRPQFGPWLTAITNNAIADFRRRRVRQPEELPDD
jgi:DNA-directed RNA polymerase specialized sigma24 family protein